jgi:Fe2+ or Zn2+ uptake regulation protein
MKEYRTTKQNQMILSIAQAHHDHPTADQIYLEVRAEDDRISRGTVYRNLEKLADTGKLLHVKVPGADRYDCRLDLHYHMICKQCHRVFDAPVDYCRELDERAIRDSDFHVERHRLVFEGLCSECMMKNQEST